MWRLLLVVCTSIILPGTYDTFNPLDSKDTGVITFKCSPFFAHPVYFNEVLTTWVWQWRISWRVVVIAVALWWLRLGTLELQQRACVRCHVTPRDEILPCFLGCDVVAGRICFYLFFLFTNKLRYCYLELGKSCAKTVNKSEMQKLRSTCNFKKKLRWLF